MQLSKSNEYSQPPSPNYDTVSKGRGGIWVSANFLKGTLVLKHLAESPALQNVKNLHW